MNCQILHVSIVKAIYWLKYCYFTTNYNNRYTNVPVRWKIVMISQIEQKHKDFLVSLWFVRAALVL